MRKVRRQNNIDAASEIRHGCGGVELAIPEHVVDEIQRQFHFFLQSFHVAVGQWDDIFDPTEKYH